MLQPSYKFLAVFGLLLTLSASLVSAVDVIISEILASNTSGLTDEDGDDSDWIELTNLSAAPIDLAGWHLSDSATSLDKWAFPSVTIAAGEELIVFASGKDRALVGAELHTDFKLSSGGEFLALVRPDGVTVDYQFDPYPQQYPDISYGAGQLGGSTSQLVGPDDTVRFKVPADDSEDVGVAAPPWNSPSFDASAWTAAGLGLAYEDDNPNDPYYDHIGTNGDVRVPMDGNGSTIYMRIPFEVADPAEVTALTLKVRYDDGFAAMINGGAVLASANAPAALGFDSTASTSHGDTSAIALVNFPLDVATANLVTGANILAVHGLNRSAGNSDFLFDCELEAQITPAGGSIQLVYMTNPTPGAPNSGGVADLGPVIRDVTENPARPDVSAQTELLITAEVLPTQYPISGVTLFHRQSFDGEVSLSMNDDGLAPDLAAGDGIFSASIPLAGLDAGEMLRWRVEAEDSDGTISRAPFFGDPLNSPEYFGTAALDPGIVSNMPVLEWFIANPGGANNRTGTRASCMHLGEFYDNIFCRIRGASSAGLPKKSYKFDFNTDNHFRLDANVSDVRAEEFNLNNTWTDKAYVRQQLSYEIYDLAGSPGSQCFLMRVQQNGEFFNISAYTEQVDKRLLKREARIDDDGALYKMFNAGTSGTGGVEKKNRTYENNADLSAFVGGMQSSGTTLENFIFDNVDIPRQLNYLAATVLTQNNDNMSKNYYLYRDSEGSGEWTQMPWDTDLTWGSHYMTGDNISHDGIWATADYVLGGRQMNAPISPSHPFVGIQELPGNRSWNRIIDKLFENKRFKDMFRRRMRTLMDELLAPPLLDDRIDALVLQLGNDAVADKAKWGQFGTQQTLAQAIGVLENDYITPRRTHLFTTHLASNAVSYPTPETSSSLLPDAQVGSPTIDFGSYDANPASGNQDEEFIKLQNPNAFAVDISGWQLAGGVNFVFLPGTIIEANRSLYVSPKVATFRARATSPTGGEGLNVEGDYGGQISMRGETIKLMDAVAATVATLTTPATPSLQQDSLRITELHYAPSGGKSFEFIELKNISGSAIALGGVNFSDGVSITLSGSLASGAYGIVVADPANFPGLNVIGTFTGSLNNGGEQLTLRDASGENILSFNYDGDWFPPANAGGYSIDILDDTADWSSWDLQSRWALSCEIGGSPGVANPEPHSNAYGAWGAQFFTAAELADPMVSGALADASGDGIANLVKYALGLDPKIASQSGLPTVATSEDKLTIAFQRLQKAADLTLVVEVSTDLLSWNLVATEISSSDNDDGTEDVVFESPIALSTQPKQFMRLSVTQN
ncbi:MAG: hypothetical protein ACI8XO_003845 [Verrucomicrobiales bacterium]|jgi:hypothetical protein